MARKTTAHRPSQSHMKYVTTKDGRKVINTAYSPRATSDNINVSSALSPTLGNDPVHDPNPVVRASLAQQGKHLDELSRDPHDIVRYYVAQQGYGYDILVHDPCPIVRMGVAESGHCLQKLVDDDDWGVRVEVAKHGYGLDKLVHDDHEDVRIEVAHQRYGHNILKDDSDGDVRGMVAYVSDDPHILSHIANTYDDESAVIAEHRLRDINSHLVRSK